MIRWILGLAAASALLAGCTPPPASEPAEPKPQAESASEPASTASAEDQAKAQELAEKGTKVMTDPKLKPSEKYPKALDLYREALALDPQNKEAKLNKALIESIYKSMNRPVPGEA